MLWKSAAEIRDDGLVFIANKSSLWSLPYTTGPAAPSSPALGADGCVLQGAGLGRKDWNSLGRDLGHQCSEVSRKHWVPLRALLVEIWRT